ncbi:MAG: hypothetical protein IKU38_01320 [Clostridia bacterium]|nr:hypothetical protein [Clostridia bacterium]
MSRQKNRMIFVGLLAAVLALIFALNMHTQLMMDDYDYSFSWSTGDRLSGVADIIASQAAHYRLWGGRSVTHFLAQLFLFLGKQVFNAANAVMYVLLLLEIYVLCKRRESAWDWRLILMAHLLMFGFIEFFGVAFLWLDGACNYLWGTALALVPLIIARSEREGGFFDSHGLCGYLAVPVCFFAGWTNENTACGVLGACALLLIWDVIRKRRIRLWRVLSLAAQAAGVAVLLLAPGNFARAGQEASRGFVMEMIYRAAVVAYCMLRYAGIPLALTAAALFAAVKKKAGLRIGWLCVLGAAAVLSAGALIGSPQISDRSFTAVIVLLIAMFGSVMNDIKLHADARSVRIGAALGLVCICLGVHAVSCVKAHEASWISQLEKIEQAAGRGDETVEIGSVASSSRYAMDIILAPAADQWPNSTLSKYYGIDIVGL